MQARSGWGCAAMVLMQGVAMAGQLPLERLTASPALSGPQAREVHVSPDGERVGYLRSADDDRYRQDLWVFERSTGQARRLIDARSLGVEPPLSAAEAARRERERMAGTQGIVHYQWSPDGRQVLFTLGDALCLATLHGAEPPTLNVLARGDDLIDPRLSPQGHFVAYVRGQNLHVLELATGRTRQLTTDGGGTVHNAEAEFVAQEEMDQTRGHWWAPDESLIAFTRYDEAPVPVQRRFEVHADRTEVVAQRYPVTGGPNVALSLGLVAPGGGAVRWVDLGPNPDIYLPRVDWLPDSRSLSYQRQSRDQKTLTLQRVDVSTLGQTRLRTDTARTWVDLHSDLRFLRRQDAFIWAADRDGRKHLELVGLDGHTRHALTAGDWQVDELLAVDEDAGVLYVAGDQGLALERHVWRLKLDGSNADRPERLTEPGGWHLASFPEGQGTLQLWVDQHHDPATPPRTRVRDMQGRHLAWIEENRLDDTHPYAPYRDHHVLPEFGTLPAEDGTSLSYSVLKPPGFDPARRYPVLLNVYGGPFEQLVSRRWGSLFLQAMAQRGFIVFTLDNRGSARRGRAFSDVIYGRLGEVEVRDQLAGLRWLKQQPGVDGERVGLFGWSYGGYMTLMLLAKAPPSSFAAGVAVAPVARQDLYDTHYTERYLGTPQANPEGYRASSVFSVLPGLNTPLLLVHGMADDNVLFTNSTELMAAMQAQGKPFRLMTYPGGKHGLAGRAMTDHVNRLIADYFDEVVKGRR